MNKHFLKKTSVIALGAVLWTSAQITSAQTLSQEQALSTILSNNPSLKAMSGSGAAGTILARGAGQLSGPELEGEYMFNAKGGHNKWGIGISQKFQWPSSYKAQREAARAQAEIATTQYIIQRKDLEQQARLTIAQGVYAQAQLDILLSLEKNLDSVASSIEYGYNHGQLTILDLKKIKLEKFKLQHQIKTLTNDISEIQDKLAEMAASPDLTVDLKAYSPLPLQSIDEYLKYADGAPEVSLAQQQADVARLKARAESLSRNPELGIGYRHAYEDGTHFNGLSISIGLPSWGHNYNKDYENSMEQVSRILSQDLTGSIKAIINNHYHTAVDMQAIMKEYNNVVLDSEYPELWIMAYNGGQINVITLVQELNYYIEATFQYLDSDYRYRQALIYLHRYQ